MYVMERESCLWRLKQVCVIDDLGDFESIFKLQKLVPTVDYILKIYIFLSITGGTGEQ